MVVKARVLITGDRHWSSEITIQAVLEALEIEHQGKENFCIIEGGATGADSIAAKLAHDRGICVFECLPCWKVYGKSAGMLRNKWMLEWVQPTLIVAFHNNIENSLGTKDMVSRAKRAGIEVLIVKEEDVKNS